VREEIPMLEMLRAKIRNVPNFPKAGILFRDITPLLLDPEAFRAAIGLIKERFAPKGVEVVAGIETRGLILASALAYDLSVGLALMRKPGKLPYKTYKATYALEYGTDALEIHQDAITPGQKVLIVDDLIATGGTAAAAVELVKQLGGEVIGLAFLVELTDLKGRERLKDQEIYSLIQF